MITLTVGISNSGKTTWAEQQVDILNINRDDQRAEMSGGNLNAYKFSKAREKAITLIQFEMAAWAVLNNKDIIVSDTNLNPKTRAKWAAWAQEQEVELHIKEFPCEPHIAKQRNQKREHSIPVSVIDQQYAAWREYKWMPTYTGTPGKPSAVIFDVDGTLASMNARHPFDWNKVCEDTPRRNVVNLAKSLHKAGIKILVMSGRDGVCYEDTLKWLHDNNVPVHALSMRAAGDTRPDAVIKEELFWGFVADKYDVQFVVDDRDQMVARWRAMGLECWQIQSGDF